MDDEKIDHNLVINPENLELITCKICKGILFNPLQCSICHQSFCQKCIESYQKKNEEKHCINNCQNPIFKSSNDINALLEKLKFKCKNGCDDEIPYKELEDHYKNKCSKREIDYKSEYLKYKNKYEDLLKQFEELKNNNEIKQNENINIQEVNNEVDIIENNQKTIKSQYHCHDLIYKSLYTDNWSCILCLESFEKKTKSGYICDKCGFNICSKCVIIEKSGYIFPDVFKSNKHEHLLRENKSWGYYQCDECNQKYKGVKKTFRCDKKECNYDLCTECIRKEKSQNEKI